MTNISPIAQTVTRLTQAVEALAERTEAIQGVQANIASTVFGSHHPVNSQGHESTKKHRITMGRNAASALSAQAAPIKMVDKVLNPPTTRGREEFSQPSMDQLIKQLSA